MSLINYVNAGYNAYRMAYSTGHFGADHKPQRIDNPYSKRPFRELWLRGWREAQKEFEEGGIRANFRHNPFSDNRRVLTFVRELEKRENRKPGTGRYDSSKPKTGTAPKSKTYHPVQLQNIKRRPNTVNPALAAPYGKSAPASPINLKRLEKFNKKHRTVA